MVAIQGLFVLAMLAGQTAAPPLPAVALDRFPAATRTALAPLVDRARRAPADAAAAGALAMALHAWEQWDAAHAAYQRARALDRAAFRWAYLDGIVLLRLGHADDAVEALRAALALPNAADYLPLRVKLAEALLDSGQQDEAARRYTELARVPAAEPVAELALGRIAADAGRQEEALTHLRTAVARFPEYGAAHYALARVYRALGRADEAQAALEAHQRYGARWPAIDDPLLAGVTTSRRDARAALQRGQKQAAAGDVSGAIAAYEAAVAGDPASAQAHVGLVSLYGRERQWTRAETHYRAAVALGAELEEAHYNYGVLLGLQGRWEEAAAAYRLALGVNPRNPQAHNNLGQVLERRRAFDEAAAEYRSAIDASPAFRLARFNLARMLILQERPREAIAELRKTLDPRDAETPRYVFALATAYVRAGDKAEGAKRAEEARQLALAYDQAELADAIARHLASLR